MSQLEIDFYAAMVEQARQLATLVEGADPAARVPSCPDWDLLRLSTHVGQAHRFGADNVRRRVSGPGELVRPTALAAPAGVDPDWLVEGALELVEEVRAAGADAPVWNFTGERQQASFWLRRMTHETAVHRADAALALRVPYGLSAELAADGLSEWLELVTSPGAAAVKLEVTALMRGLGQLLHLHATDEPGLGDAGEWLIRRGPESVTWEHGHAKGDVAVRGTAADLLLMLLGRIEPEPGRFAVFGDEELLRHWRAHVTF